MSKPKACKGCPSLQPYYGNKDKQGKRIGWSFVEHAVEVEGWSLTQMNYFVGVAKLNGVWKE